MKLNLGSGSKKIEGYLSVDFRQLDGVDIVDDISKLSTIPWNSVDEILAEHVVEHFHAHEIKYVLLEWWRRLKVGGKITITTPNLLWMVGNLYNSYKNIFEPKEQTVKFENHRAREILLNFLYGGGEYKGNDHFNLFDASSLMNLLHFIGFENMQASDPSAQNITITCQKYAIDMDQYNNIVLSSVATAYGDRLMMYPIAKVFQHFYPNKEVFVHINPNERQMWESFEECNLIYSLDDTLPKTLIIRESFDVDMKWRPWLYGIEDGPAVWSKIKKLCEFNVDDKLHFKYKKIVPEDSVAVFIDSYREKMSIPYEFSGFGKERYLELFQSMPETTFAAFCGPAEDWEDFNLPNVINVGKLNSYEILHMLLQCSMLVSISTSVSAMTAWMAGIDRITLHSQDVEGNAVWSGIPDLCVLPPARFQAMWRRDLASVFLKPDSGETVEWKFPHYFCNSIEKDRKMYKVNNIAIYHIANYIKNFGTDFSYNLEEGTKEGLVCKSCKLNTDMNICAYVHEKPEVFNC